MIFVLMGVPPLGLTIPDLNETIGALDAFVARNMDQGHTLVAPETWIYNGNSRVRNAQQSRQDVWPYESLYAWIHRRNIELGQPLRQHVRQSVRATYYTILENVRAGVANEGLPASRRARDTVNVAEWHSIYSVPAVADPSAARKDWIDWCDDIDRHSIETIKLIGRALIGYTPEMMVEDGTCYFRLMSGIPGDSPATMDAKNFYRYMVRMRSGFGVALSSEGLNEPLPALPRPPRRMMI